MLRPAALLTACLLAGCQTEPVSRHATGAGSLTPPGPSRSADLVQPQIVGDRLLSAGEPELALAAFKRAAIAEDGGTIETRLAIANANIALGRLKQAERELRSITSEDDRNAAGWNNLGVVLMKTGEIGEAHRTLKIAFALQPSPNIRDNLRLSRERIDRLTYDDVEAKDFTLTRRADGVFDLREPGLN